MVPRYFRFLMIAALAMLCLHLPAYSQSGELERLNKEIVKLNGQGKYLEATVAATKALKFAIHKFGPDHPDVATSLSNLAVLYGSQGRYAEAEPLFKRALSIREQVLGPDHPDVGAAYKDLAGMYESQDRYAEAELLYKRALAICEQAFGPDHQRVGTSLDKLAGLYRSQGRYAEAEPLYKRVLAISKKALGPVHPRVGDAFSKLGGVYWRQGRYTEAEPLFKQDLTISKKALGPVHPRVGTSLNNLATLYESQGRYVEAEPLYKRALAIAKKALGPNHHRAGAAFQNLADLYRSQGRYADAEPLYQRALAIREQALGPNHPDVGASLDKLGGLYWRQGRYTEAEPLYKRALTIREQALGPDHPDVGTSINNVAGLYQSQGRYAEAEPLYKRTLAISEKALGPKHPYVGTMLNNLAALYERQGRYSEAERLNKRDLAISKEALGADHPNVAAAYNNLAGIYESQGRYAEAEELYKRALAIFQKALGPDHRLVSNSLNNLAGFYLAQSDWKQATDYYRLGTELVVRHTRHGATIVGQSLTGKKKTEAARSSFAFSGFVKSAHRLAGQQRQSYGGVLSREMFQAAQWAAGSEAANSLAKMATRGASANGELAALVRDRQDLVGEWQQRDAVRTVAVAKPPDERDRATESLNVARLAAIDQRIAEIDKQLAAEFADYAALANPGAESVADVQSQLRDTEALVLFLDTPERKPIPEETFVWVVTKNDVRWVRSDIGTEELKHEVTALRCFMDPLAWEESADCKKLVGEVPASDFPVFDSHRAHKLFKALFGEIEDLIEGKSLLIVPSGPLTQLPFHVLVTEPPRSEKLADVAWLAKQHAITVLPAVSSLKALRAHARASGATKEFIGYGNPLLSGNENKPSHVKAADLALKIRGCADAVKLRTASLRGADQLRGVPAPAVGDLRRVFPSEVRRMAPLPETADELCEIARASGADLDRDIHLGAALDESLLKELSKSGGLADYKVISFSTHGAMAGDLQRGKEPGLIMTPPDKATDENDGYLTASEITELKLDADWVILSACNTAAGQAKGAEALSGLARAFFYAGTRSLLVSHWSVYSQASVELITTAFAMMKDDPRMGRAQALRQAMLAVMKKGGRKAHPAYWAPFVVVGEGANISKVAAD